jgi:hypothetical protein
MKVYRTNQVFVPGGMPTLTYVPRAERNLEARLAEAKDNLCKLVTVTGSTKSGKTVLTNRVFPRSSSVWIDGGTVKEEDDLWNFILDAIGGYSEETETDADETASKFSGEIGAATQLPFVFEGQGKLGAEYAKKRGSFVAKKLSLKPRAAAITQLRETKLPVIIDDFHYLDRDFQGNIIRALKPLIFEGLPVILIAIPHRRYDAVKVEREITGRIEAVTIAAWEINELLQIPKGGFPLLNLFVDDVVLYQFAAQAYGSPHLMQEFCRSLASEHGVKETVASPLIIKEVANDLFKRVAEGTGRVIFDKLAKGPRQRSDRMLRKLKDGTTADIYKVVLLGLAKISPGLQTVEYEQLRSVIKDILAEQIPAAHEVTRVLEKMAEIASSDEASTPVLDWEKNDQKLHITDPFFAFFLKWGVAS